MIVVLRICALFILFTIGFIGFVAGKDPEFFGSLEFWISIVGIIACMVFLNALTKEYKYKQWKEFERKIKK